jgi:hypothetical protein
MYSKYNRYDTHSILMNFCLKIYRSQTNYTRHEFLMSKFSSVNVDSQFYFLNIFYIQLGAVLVVIVW